MGAKVGALWPCFYSIGLKTWKHTLEINSVFLLSFAVSAEVHCDLCLGVLLRHTGGFDFFSCGRLGWRRGRDHRGELQQELQVRSAKPQKQSSMSLVPKLSVLSLFITSYGLPMDISCSTKAWFLFSFLCWEESQGEKIIWKYFSFFHLPLIMWCQSLVCFGFSCCLWSQCGVLSFMLRKHTLLLWIEVNNSFLGRARESSCQRMPTWQKSKLGCCKFSNLIHRAIISKMTISTFTVMIETIVTCWKNHRLSISWEKLTLFEWKSIVARDFLVPASSSCQRLSTVRCWISKSVDYICSRAPLCYLNCSSEAAELQAMLAFVYIYCNVAMGKKYTSRVAPITVLHYCKVVPVNCGIKCN